MNWKEVENTLVYFGNLEEADEIGSLRETEAILRGPEGYTSGPSGLMVVVDLVVA